MKNTVAHGRRRPEFLGPEEIKGRKVTITFIADRELDLAIAQPNTVKWEPGALGGLTRRGENSNFIGSLPFHACGHILTMLQHGKIKYVIFSDHVMRYGSASIKEVTLTGEYNLRITEESALHFFHYNAIVYT